MKILQLVENEKNKLDCFVSVEKGRIEGGYEDRVRKTI